MAKYTMTNGRTVEIPDEGVLYQDESGQNVHVRKGGTLYAIRSKLLSGVDVSSLPVYKHTGETSQALAQLGGTGGGTQVEDTSLFKSLKPVVGEEIVRSVSRQNPQGADIKSNIPGSTVNVTTPTIEENLARTGATPEQTRILSEAQKGGAPVSAEAAQAAGVVPKPAQTPAAAEKAILELPKEGRILTDAEISAIRKQQAATPAAPVPSPVPSSVDATVARAKAMVEQTKAEGDKPFAGSSFDTGFPPPNFQAEVAKLNKEANEVMQQEVDTIAKETTPEVRESSKLLSALGDIFSGDTAKETEKQPSLAQTFQDKRAQLNVGPLETRLGELDKELAQLDTQYASTIEGEERRVVGLTAIRRRQSAIGTEYQRQRRDLVAERESVARELDVKYGVVNTMVSLTGQDYANATQAYNTKFNQALSMFNALKGVEEADKLDMERRQDNARANVQIMMNLVKEGSVDYNTLPEATKLEIRKAETAAGLPVGFTASVIAATGKTEVQFLPSYTAEDGARVQPVATKDKKGAYTISNVTLPKAETEKSKTEKRKEEDFRKARQFIADNPDARESDLQVSLRERTDLSDGDISALIKERAQKTPPTAENVKAKIIATLEPLKTTYSRSEARQAAEAQLKSALKVDGDLPQAYTSAINDALVQVYGRTLGQKIFPGGR